MSSLDGQAEEDGSMFECNICFDAARDPVVTMCGHLFCWSCIYQWLITPTRTNACPVCNSGISKEQCVPVYGRGKERKDPRVHATMPQRPPGQRSLPQQNQYVPSFVVNHYQLAQQTPLILSFINNTLYTPQYPQDSSLPAPVFAYSSVISHLTLILLAILVPFFLFSQ
eukprot:c14452_g1_i3.p1 GENE.c14452_g1_i3~~c14452_g1_i3.p1  ORF type:complete len:169 (+),score=16.85 c14452_g1_i3:3-509(+)